MAPLRTWLWPTLRALAWRRGLWMVAIRQGKIFSMRNGSISFGPPRVYMRMRAETAYGDPDAAPAPEDVVAWLEWCRRSAACMR